MVIIIVLLIRLNEAKYQYLVNKRENIGLKKLNNTKAFTEYLNDMQDIYKILKSTTQAEYVMY